ncbi:MAG: C40 family peptidase [Agrococcus casei]|uniref:C40 family peptidase n=1 Tax=Agrococcus casei TaxID=343512 RepID=UPI003F8FDAE1
MTEENRSTEIVHAADAPTRRQKVGGAFKRISVAALAVGLAGGIALPAVAGSTGMQQDSSLASSFAGQEQNYEVSPELEAALALVPDTIDATSREELEAMQARIEADAKAEEEEGIEVDEEAPSNDAPPVSDNAGGIVGIAQQYLGVPYVFGGSTPAGFDCSGFTQYVYAQVGVSLPRIAGAQASVGTPVGIGSVQPGDLLVWGGHTAIYVGNDQVIHAPYEGTTVRYESFSGMIAAMGTPQARRF